MDLNIRKITNLPPSPDNYIKRGPHARVFSHTLAHGNNETEEDKKRGVSMERSKAGTNETKWSQRLIYSWDISSPRGR